MAATLICAVAGVGLGTLAAAKRAVDPGGICNPGVLVPLHDAS